MTLLNTSLGIGTTAPSSKLHVFGDFIVENNMAMAIGLSNNSGTGNIAQLGLAYTANEYCAQASAGDLVIRNIKKNIYILSGSSNPAIAVLTNNNAIFYNNVGIGTLTPGYKLDVSGDINYTGTLRLNGTAVSLGGSSQWTSSGANVYVTTSNVGIGTSSPAYKLDVSGDIRAAGSLNATSILSTLTLVNSFAVTGNSTVAYNGIYSIGTNTVNYAPGSSWITVQLNTPTTQQIQNTSGYTLSIVITYGGGNTSRSYNDTGIQWYVVNESTSVQTAIQTGFVSAPALTVANNEYFNIRQANNQNIQYYGNPFTLSVQAAGGIVNCVDLNVSSSANVTGNANISGKCIVGVNNFTSPTIGVTGGVGDKLIMFPGTSLNYPYSIGIEAGIMWFSVPTGSGYKWYTNGVQNMIINSSGFVGIGTNTSPSYALDVTGAIRATGDITAFSDIRYKTNLKIIDNALNRIDSINGYTFERINKDDVQGIIPIKRHAGVIAQEIEKILPEVVYEDNENNKSVAYGNLTALLIQAVKELKTKYEDICKELIEIKSKL
jgi:hypothetical protein